MDKNMIKIDDLLRQRLGDTEEQDRPAAWMQMRDLLDKQMPVNRVIGGAANWRRMFAYVAGLALLAAVSVGGYEMAQSFSTDNKIPDNGLAANTAAPATTGLAGSAINSLPDTRLEAEAAAQPAPATDAASTLATTNSATNGQQKETNTVSQKDAATSNNKKNKSLNNNSLQASNKSNTTNNNQYNSGNKSSTNYIAASSNTSGNAASNNTQPNRANNNNANNNTSSNTSGNNASNNNRKPGSGNQKDALAALPSNQQQTIASSNSEPVTKEIPFKKIELRGKDGVEKMDTIFNGEDVRKVTVPGNNNELLAKNNTDENSGSNIMPASAAQSEKKESGSEEVVMNKLGDHKVSSKKMKNFHPGRFEEMVKNAKFRMGAVKFYPGIVGGANIAFNGNAGIQAGLAGNLAISDRWSILTEVKYAYRWNSGKEKMQDDFIDNVKYANINNKPVYTYDSIEHYYNFTNFSSLEVPLMATYTHNRYVFMVGGNFRYNFKINNAEEVEQRYLLEQEKLTTSEPIFETDKKILLTDFSNTMNIAPMIGFGYIMKPGWRIDCRLSKSVWNNASTFGQKEISKNLYNMPQVQFNVTYRISSNRHQIRRPR